MSQPDNFRLTYTMSSVSDGSDWSESDATPVENRSGDANQRLRRVGVCAMSAKATSKPMSAILDRLRATGDFEIIIFEEDAILNNPVESWPIVDCLISFFSTGFPLDKAIQYNSLRRPLCVNDLPSQKLLFDRRIVHSILRGCDVPVPPHIVVSRDDIYHPTVKQYDSHIEVDGVRIDKPFVEKPVSGEDHNIHIYFPPSQGGGCTRLFRKIGNKSSEHDSGDVKVRTSGSFIYEQYLAVDDKVDVKVYAVGPDFAHAETRKSPVVDGVVERTKDGQEVRNITDLSPEEKVIARKVYQAFGQMVCGFDLLRKGDQSYVCDVNGWSSVKSSAAYYDSCAAVLRSFFLKASPRDLPFSVPRPGSAGSTGDIAHGGKLRALVAVFRHADRTPKQKIKFKVFDDMFLNYFDETGEQLSIKGEKKLQKVLEATEKLLQNPETLKEDVSKLEQFALVLKKGYAGTRIQLKPQEWEELDSRAKSSADKECYPGAHRKRACSTTELVPVKVTKGLLVCKWGGQLTSLGVKQATDVGNTFRTQVLAGEDPEKFLKNVKCFANDEKRNRSTAELFTKALLGMGKEEDLPDGILLADQSTHKLLDDVGSSRPIIEAMKERLHKILTTDREIVTSEEEEMDAMGFLVNSGKPFHTKYRLMRGLNKVGNPRKSLERMLQSLRTLVEELREQSKEEADAKTTEATGESVVLLRERWEKLLKDYYDPKTETFDTSKICDIYDAVKCDVLHNKDRIKSLPPLFKIAKPLADIVSPQEYGVEPHEKLDIGIQIAGPLLRRLIHDMVAAEHRSIPRTRLYFTSESHLHALYNLLPLMGITEIEEKREFVEFSYLTHVVFKLYEFEHLDHHDPRRFYVTLALSPGCNSSPFNYDSTNYPITRAISLHSSLPLHRMEDTFNATYAMRQRGVSN